MKDKELLADYLLRVADDHLILAQRLGEWCGHAPEMETDIALTNIALDLLGFTKSLYQYIGELRGKGETEDDLAYLRTERAYKNVLLVELPNGEYSHTIIRQLLFDVYQKHLLESWVSCDVPFLNQLAKKSLKETQYHIRFSHNWTVRLGDGTEVSHGKMLEALEDIWAYVFECFDLDEHYQELCVAHSIALPESFKNDALEEILATLTEAKLKIPIDVVPQRGGRQGIHTEHMGFILSDLQYMQRTYPNMSW